MKKERGAITLITLATILFMIAFLISTFTIIMNRRQAQAEIKKETKEIYESEVEKAEEIYNSYFAEKNSQIPIKSASHLSKIRTGKNIVVSGKIYKCSEEAEYNISDTLEWTAMPMIYGNSKVISSKVESVGEQVVDTTDSHYGKYKITIIVADKKSTETTSTEQDTTNENSVEIYLDEPLRKVENYADYIDLKNGKLVRNVEVISTTATTVETGLRGLTTPKTQDFTILNEIKGKGNQIIKVNTTVEPSKILTYYK